jgi:hypothetical protein
MFAAGTTVPVERSRAEVERILVRYGASAFSSSWDARRATVGFAFKRWHVRFDLEYPDPGERRFTHAAGRYQPRSKADAARAYDAELRRLWRSLAILLKAKLDCVTSGVTTFEKEFLAALVIPGTNETVAELAIPQLTAARDNGSRTTTPLLSAPEAP